jgi:LPS export ABC transporter protein LptC
LEPQTLPPQDTGLCPIERVAREPKLPPVRLWVWVVVALVLGGLFLAQQKTNTPPEDWTQVPEGEGRPDALIEKLHLVSSVKGVKQWELFATQARLYQERKQAYADDLFVQYFKNGKIVSTLTADKGIIQTDTNDTSADGHVELLTENGAKLETEHLQWDATSESILTNSRVHIYKGADDITAVGMVSDAKLNNIRFMREVRTKVRDVKEIENFEKRKKF